MQEAHIVPVSMGPVEIIDMLQLGGSSVNNQRLLAVKVSTRPRQGQEG